jgi:hypothetical protein
MDDDGKNKLKPIMESLDPEDREIAESVLGAYLGHVKHMSAFWRTTQSAIAFTQVVTLLPFAAFASIPDFGGAIMNSKDFKGVTAAFKQIASQITDPKQAKRLALDINVVMSETAANAWMSQADSDFLDPRIRKATDVFFKYTGLTAVTNISRHFAAGMGKRFIIEHANHDTDRSTRYLDQLGLTAKDVKAWEQNDFSFDGENGAKIKKGLRRFVESSVLRPNAAERPIWANDPRFMLIWQLKSFMYSFQKVMIGGAVHEAVTRYAEADASGKGKAAKGAAMLMAGSPVVLMTAIAFLPLAMMGLELREYAKVGISHALGFGDMSYLRTDSMDWGTYTHEILDRSGLTGMLSMINMATRNAEWGGSFAPAVLGPTAEFGDDLIRNPWEALTGRLDFGM